MPVASVEAALRVILVEPLPGEAMLAGFRLTVRPFGTLLTLNETAELKLFFPLSVSVVVTLPLSATVTLLVPSESLKVGGAATVTEIVMVLVELPPAATTEKV